MSQGATDFSEFTSCHSFSIGRLCLDDNVEISLNDRTKHLATDFYMKLHVTVSAQDEHDNVVELAQRRGIRLGALRPERVHLYPAEDQSGEHKTSHRYARVHLKGATPGTKYQIISRLWINRNDLVKDKGNDEQAKDRWLLLASHNTRLIRHEPKSSIGTPKAIASVAAAYETTPQAEVAIFSGAETDRYTADARLSSPQDAGQSPAGSCGASGGMNDARGTRRRPHNSGTDSDSDNEGRPQRKRHAGRIGR